MSLFTLGQVFAQTKKSDFKQIFPLGEKNDANAQYFIGQSYLAVLTNDDVTSYNLTFEPGCRNNWHIHHKGGQILYCTAGNGGLGHMAIKLVVSKGAEVYAFTTSPSKVNDIMGFGAKEAIVVNSAEDLKPWFGKMDFMISTVPYAYDMSNYISCVKPYGYFTQVGQPVNGELTINNFNMIFNRVNFNGSLIGGIPETQEVMNYCAENKIYPQIQMIKAEEINEAWKKVVNKEARYRYVIDAATI